MSDIAVIGLRGLPELVPGDDLGGLLCRGGALRRWPARRDVVCVAQKAVSKVEGRSVALEDVTPSPRAIEIAADDGDPRMIEVILGETARIVRRRGSFLICQTRHGFGCAAAGVDRSNAGGGDVAILLPLDPDASARGLRDAFAATAQVGVIVTDSFGRPFRLGTTGVAVGCAGSPRCAFTPATATTPGACCRDGAARRRSGRVRRRAGRRPVRRCARRRRPRPRVRPLGRRASLMPAERDLFRGGGDRSG